MDMAESITEFLTSGRQAGWSAKTLEGYRWRLNHLQEWLGAQNIHSPTELNRSLLRHYGAAIHEGWRPATVKGAVSCIRSYLRFLAAEALVSEKLFEALRVPRVPKQKQRSLTSEEFLALVQTCARPVTYGLAEREAIIAAVRNAAIISVLYDSMLRASELVALHVHDVDFARCRLLVEAGKGGDYRYASFSDDTEVALRAWLKIRKAAPAVDWLFISIAGNTPGCQLTTRGLRMILKNLGERAGVPDLSPHAFRRGSAIAKMRNGMPLRMLTSEAGWSSVTMADVYTRAYELAAEAPPEVQKYSPVKAAKRRRANGSPPAGGA